MVIECKRKRVLSNYELDEEAAMRQLFIELEVEAAKKGLHGRFELQLPDVHQPAQIAGRHRVLFQPLRSRQCIRERLQFSREQVAARRSTGNT